MSKKNDFPTVEELSEGFSEFRLEQSQELAGTTLRLYDEQNGEYTYTFRGKDELEVRTPQQTAALLLKEFTLVSPRKGIYLLDYIESHAQAVSITIVLDLNRKIGTVMRGQPPTRQEADVSQLERAKANQPMTSVKAAYYSVSIDTPFTAQTEKHAFTQDLVGKHIRFRYSSNDTYEHIYLNDRFYTWHCVKGIEKGLCDTDRCYYLKLADNLYWFTWLEKVVPTIGTVIEDLSPEVMRSFGKIAGYENYDHGNVTNFPVGSYATELS